MGVESEIREALTNLIFNAVDAMPDGGTLTLRTRLAADASGKSASQERVCVEVSDTGIGMDEETRRRCLEPFFTTKGERGTGPGLAMVLWRGATARRGNPDRERARARDHDAPDAPDLSGGARDYARACVSRSGPRRSIAPAHSRRR
jgi:hypothetical protein